MARNKSKYRSIYIVTAALMVAMIGGYALAATTVATLTPGQSSNVTNTPTPTGFANIGAISSESLVTLTAGMTGSLTAGTQTLGAVGISGAPRALTVCAAACVQNLRPASTVAEAIGDYGEQIVLTVFQPATGGTSLGFDFVMSIVTTTGTVGALGYLATNVSTAGATVTVTVFIFVDMGTTTAPIINSLSVVFNQCSSATTCP